MWSAIVSWLGGPVVNGLIEAYKAKLANEDQAGQQAVEVAKEALVAEVQARAEANKVIMAEQGRWYTALPRWAVEVSFAAYVFKCVMWDTVLGWGSTPAIGGDLATWGGWLMAMWFGGLQVKTTIAAVRSWWR